MSEIKQAHHAITEGFICANCRKQFKDVPELLSHYEKCQSGGSGGLSGESSENGNTFKGFFEKAKQKLTFNEQKLNESQQYSQVPNQQQQGGGSGFQEKASPTPTYYNDFDNASEVSGVSRSFFEEFKKVRSGRMERYAAESNKLKIRLSKLVLGLEKFPALMTKSSAGFQDSVEWKTHEKSVVNWLEEKPVTRCPECAQGFNLLRRKHHCRLCGSILCNECSGFIPLAEAFEILHSDRKIREDTACASIHFRTCAHCARILRQEIQSPFNQMGKTFSGSSEARLLSVYDTIRERMTEIDKLLPQLVTVVDSIRSGESLYSREEANSLRSKLLRENEQIDLLSKQISAIKSESTSMMMLQQRIRQNCIAYIREFIKSVPMIPDQAEDTSSTSSSLGGASSSHVMTGDGWSISAPDHHHEESSSGRPSMDMDENPIQQQIRNVKFYIEQAKAAGKMDEVEMLAASLRDLLIWQKENNI